MKKIGTRSILLTLLVMASLSSYVYLSMVPTQPVAQDAYSQPILEDEGSDIVLPDVEMAKKLLEAGKKVIHITR
jgi:hypothetical protein